VAANKLELQKILLTHAHIDHAGATGELAPRNFNESARFAIVGGDVLSKGSIGRTDFPGGDHATLIRSIREHLFPLGDDVRFLPRHGPLPSFGAERRTNPFVGDHLFTRRTQERGA
jgi:glyoxylase-like metal-dependent hydrolase (beta-lactamase superfamily II)